MAKYKCAITSNLICADWALNKKNKCKKKVCGMGNPTKNHPSSGIWMVWLLWISGKASVLEVSTQSGKRSLKKAGQNRADGPKHCLGQGASTVQWLYTTSEPPKPPPSTCVSWIYRKPLQFESFVKQKKTWCQYYCRSEIENPLRLQHTSRRLPCDAENYGKVKVKPSVSRTVLSNDWRRTLNTSE